MTKPIAGVALLLAACLPTIPPPNYAYHTIASTLSSAASKPDDCNFDLLRLRPDRPFEELATIEGDGDFAPTEEQLRDVVGSQVCAAGGDALIAKPNGSGYFPGGVIIRYTASAAPAAAPASD